MQIYNLSDLDIKVASVLAELYLKDDDRVSSYFFYNHDFYKIPEGKVLRIRFDIIDESKLFKKNKKK